MQGAAMYLNNCQQNNIQTTVFNGNQASQGSALYLNNSLPVWTCVASCIQMLMSYGLGCVLAANSDWNAARVGFE